MVPNTYPLTIITNPTTITHNLGFEETYPKLTQTLPGVWGIFAISK